MCPRAVMYGVSVLLCALGLARSARASELDPGTALFFDGIEDYVTVPHDPSFPVEVFTVTAWIRAEEVTGEYQAIGGCGEGPEIDHSSWWMMVDEDGALAVRYEDDHDTWYTYSSDFLVTDGLWHHVAATRDVNGTIPASCIIRIRTAGGRAPLFPESAIQAGSGDEPQTHIP
ncbi:MAG: LamG domain-containing protein [Planctomycetota bacterium]